MMHEWVDVRGSTEVHPVRYCRRCRNDEGKTVIAFGDRVKEWKTELEFLEERSTNLNLWYVTNGAVKLEWWVEYIYGSKPSQLDVKQAQEFTDVEKGLAENARGYLSYLSPFKLYGKAE
jgi:hypothetical protein